MRIAGLAVFLVLPGASFSFYLSAPPWLLLVWSHWAGRGRTV